jgi:hypothetical protein
MEVTNLLPVTVKDSRFGTGLFASMNIRQNSVILSIQGKPLTFEQTLKLGSDECYCLQVGLNSYIIPDPPFRFSNHSCQPNCGINRGMELVALQDIKAGDELFWDYSTSMLEKHWTMHCDCGSAACRNLITDFDTLPLKLRERYLEMKMVLPFIVEALYGLPTIQPISGLVNVGG